MSRASRAPNLGRIASARQRLAAASGAASVEWIAVAGVVGAALLAGIAGAVPHAPAVPRAVGAAFERAFCLVSGGDCLGGRPRPCVVSSSSRSRSREGTLALLRLTDGRTVLREDRTDGTVVVSVEDHAGAGGRAGIHAGVKGMRAVAGIEGGAVAGRGRRFVVPGAAAAERLLARLGDEGGGARAVAGGGDGALEPAERWWALGHGGEAEASLKAKGFGGEARLRGDTVAAVRERASGGRTLVLRGDSELVGALAVPLARAGLASPSELSAELELDREGAPVALTVRAARGIHGDVRVAGRRLGGGGDRVEAEARLDLADPETRSRARELLSPSAFAAARELAARLGDRARVDVRVYATTRDETVKGATTPFGGYEVVDVVRSGRLVDALGREPGMGWARRLDCVGVA